MYKNIFKIFVLCLLLLLTADHTNSTAQTEEWLKEHYTKKEYRIPMRDGIKLFTVVYSPKDQSQKYPIILDRTPYSVQPYGADKFRRDIGAQTKLPEEGYIFVFQDVRGRFQSEGEFVDMRPYIPNKKSNKDVDESSDAYDTIDWLVKNVPNNNGNVGIWGISYPGFYAAMATIDAHPALKAASPQAPISDWFIGDDFHRRGAFLLCMGFDFYRVFGIPRDSLISDWPEGVQYDSPDAYDFFLKLGPVKNTNEKYFHNGIPFWNQLMQHGTYDDFWKAKCNLPHFKNIKPAVLIVGGWFDSEDLYGPLHIYKSIEEKNKNNKCTFLIGPWFHGGWARSDGDSLGDISFGSKTSKLYEDSLIVPFFNYYLKGKGTYNPHEVTAFNTGANKWHYFDQWPPSKSTLEKLYFEKDHKLTFDTPDYSSAYTFDSYISDPSKPVPYTATFHDAQKAYIRSYMIEDQRFAASRPDVLVYETDGLKNDVTIAGPITADLFVSTSGTDSDWIVKLIDVYPDSAPDPVPNPTGVEMGNYQMLVRYEIMRGKFRNSFEKPEPFVPNKPTEVKFTLNDAFHTFKKGHKIMIQIQSSMFPFYDRNPQTFTDIYSASEKYFQKAEQKVYFTKELPTSIILPVLK